MKKFIVVLVAVLGFASVSYGQERGYTMAFSVSGATPSLNHSNGVTPIELKTEYGYMFNSWFTLRGHFDLNMAIIDKDVRHRTSNETVAVPALGGSVGFTVFNRGANSLELVGAVGSAIAGDWQYLYGDGALRWSYGIGRDKLLVGGGIKLYKSYSSRYVSSANLYISIGYRFN